MPITPSEADMIAAAIDSALIDVHVALPGQVQTYDAAAQTATIELQVQRVLPQGINFVTESLPVLENVPVAFLRSASFFVSMPIATGDYGLVLFNEMSIDQWRSKGENTSPGDIGRHTLSGGVFMPGLNPNDSALASADSDNLVVGLDGNNAQIHITPAGSILLGTDAALGVARDTDPVEAVIPANTVIVSVSGGSGAPAVGVLNPTPITLNGTITGASANVKASD